MSSSSRVFSIPELLEIVLEHGLAKDLLLQQRVNKTWQGVIKGSCSIRRKLHYDVDLLERGVDHPEGIEWEQLDKVRWNPLLGSFRIGCREMGDNCRKVNLDLLKKFDFPTASWKAMYMTSPAVRTATLLKKDGILGPLSSKSGITIGKLAETQQQGSSLRINETTTQQLWICIEAYQ